MALFRIDATVGRTSEGNDRVTTQIPSFVLEGDIHGVTTTRDAELWVTAMAKALGAEAVSVCALEMRPSNSGRLEVL